MSMQKTILVLIVILLNATLALGAGIGSNKLTYQIEYSPNKQVEFEYQLITTSQQTMDYELYTINEDEAYEAPLELRVNFTPYVTFEPNALKNIAPKTNPKFRIKINMPASLSPPGEHGVRACVQEGQSSGGMVGSRSGACGRIIINIPYPGKYLLIGLTAHDTDLGGTAKIDVFLNNRGLEDIREITGNIYVYDENNNLVKQVSIEKTSLISRERKTQTLFIDTIGLKPGEYTAKAEIRWDNGVERKEATFRIGAEKVELLEITKTYQNNTINPVEMKVKNNWNQQTQNIYATIKVEGQEIKTPTIELGAWQEGALKTYWDTKGLNIGGYPAEIFLHYNTKEDKYTETFTVIEQKIEKPEMQKVKIPLSGLMIAVIIIIAILILLNIGLIIKLSRRKQQ